MSYFTHSLLVGQKIYVSYKTFPARCQVNKIISIV